MTSLQVLAPVFSTLLNGRFKSGTLVSWTGLIGIELPTRQLTLSGGWVIDAPLAALAEFDPLVLAVVARAMCESHLGCLPAAEALVCHDLARQASSGELTEDSAEKFIEMVHRLFAHAELLHVTCVREMGPAAQAWVEGPARHRTLGFTEAAVSTKRTRRAVLRKSFAILRAAGLSTQYPTIDLHLPPSDSEACARISDVEVDRCKTLVAGTAHNRAEAALTLALIGAQPREIGQLTSPDVDARRKTVSLPDRTLRVGREMVDALQRREEHLVTSTLHGPGPGPLFLAGSPSGEAAASGSSISMTLGMVLRDAHCRVDQLQPSAFRAWAAQQFYEGCRDLTLVKAALGERSLDSTARLIGLQMSQTHIIDVRGPLGRRRG